MKHLHKTYLNSKTQTGFSLVEVIVALAIFALLSSAAGLLMTSGFDLRQSNREKSEAQQFARQALELHKEHWSLKENYKQEGVGENVIPKIVRLPATSPEILDYLPDGMSLDIDYSCLSTNGTSLYSNEGLLNCSSQNPPLRSVVIKLYKGTGTNVVEILSVKTEVGQPIDSNR